MNNKKLEQAISDALDKALENAICKDYYYTDKQMDEVMNFINEEFGEEGPEEKYIIHELKSKYVHTDVCMAGDDECQYFVTCGMGACEMPKCVPLNGKVFKRIELYLILSQDYNPTKEEISLLGGELQRISKYPFKNQTFFGPGHTINASKEFKERYGYDCFVFLGGVINVEVQDLGEVTFMGLIPIYEQERDWMIENNSFEWLIQFFDKYDQPCVVDKQREVFIPN